MAVDGNIDVGLGLQTSQAEAAIKKLSQEFSQSLANFQHGADVLERRLATIAQAFSRVMQTAKSESQALRIQERQAASERRAISEFRRGTRGSQISDAAAQHVIAEIGNRTEILQARIQDALVRNISLLFRNTTQAVEARIRAEQARVNDLIANNTRGLIEARQVIRDRNNQRIIERAGNVPLYEAQQIRRRRNEAEFIREENDVDLIEARTIRRRRQNAELKRQIADQDLQLSQERQKAVREAIAKLRLQYPELAEAEVEEARYRIERKLTARQRREALEAERAAAKERRLQAQREREAARANALDPELQAAQGVIASRRRQELLDEARYGRAYVTNMRRQELLDYQGGAPLMGIQARVLTNYAALGTAFAGVMNLGRFVIDLDEKFHKFQAIAAASNVEMDKFKDNLIEVARNSRYTATEVAEASITLAQAGLSTQQVGESLQSIITLATASGSELAESVDVVTSVLSAFNLQTSQTVDVANSLVAALNLTKLDLPKVATAIQYVGGIAAQSNVSLNEVLASLGALSQSGIRGSTMGTGLRQLLIDLQDPSEKLLKALRGVGLTAEDINVKSRGLVNVLKGLREAGFTSADAFAAMETRGAAAFTVLSNNLDMVPKLQIAFTQASAASEAAATQMESLTSAGRRLWSTLGAAAYEALEPTLRMLSDLADAATNVITTLSQIPGALELIGTALTVLGSLAIFRILRTLFAGLGTLLPTLRNLGTAFTAVGAAAQAGAIGVTALSTALRFNWAGLALSAITALVAGFYAFGSAADQMAAKLDVVQGRVNTLTGELTELEDRNRAIEQTMQTLLQQQAALENDPLSRKAKIMEVVTAFKELGLEIDSSTASVRDLIGALDNLHAKNLSLQADKLKEVQETKLTLLTTNQQALDDFLRNVRPQRDNSISGTLASKRIPDAYLRDALGPEFAEIAALALGAPITQSGEYLQGLGARFSASNESLMRELQTLRYQQSLDQGGPDIEQQIAALGDLLAIRKGVADWFAQLVKHQTAIDAAKADLEVTKAQAVDKAVEASEGFQYFREQMNVVERAALQDREIVTSQKGKVTTAEFLEKVQGARVRLDQMYNGLMEHARILIDELEKMFPSLSRDHLSSLVYNSLNERMAQVRANSRIDVTADQKKNLAQMKADASARTRNIDAQIRNLVKLASESYEKNEIDLVKKQVIDLIDQKQRLLREVFQVEHADDSEVDRLVAEATLNEQIQSLEEQKQSYILKFLDDTDRVTKNIFQRMKDAADTEADAIKVQIQELQAKLKTVRPGEATQKIVNQIMALLDILSRLQSDSAALELQSITLTEGKPLNQRQAGSATTAMARLLSNSGVNQTIAAGIVGNLLVESGLNTRAAGDYRNGHPTAIGIAQWRGDRLDALRNFARSSNRDFYSQDTQLDFLMWELKTKYPQVWAQLQRARTAEEAADIFRVGYERPSSDPRISHEADRRAYARQLSSLDVVKDVTDISKIVSDTSKAVTAGVITTTNNDSNMAVRNLKQQIEAAMAQTRLTSDPNTVKRIIGTVDGLYQKVIDEKIKAFDTENAAALSRGDVGIQQQRKDLIDGIQAQWDEDIQKLLKAYLDKMDKEADKKVEQVSQRLEAARMFPQNYTASEIQDLENLQKLAEREALSAKLANTNQLLALIEERLAAARQKFKEDSPEIIRLLDAQNEATRRKLELEKQIVEVQNAGAHSVGLNGAIQSATRNFLQSAGVLDADGNMISAAKQFEATWGSILDTLSGGFQQLFMDLATGSKSAGDAFRSFGLTVVQALMQAIAKALALQTIMALFGDGSSSNTGFLGSLLGGSTASTLLQGIFTVPGAANGELIRGGIPGRDSVMRRVMPGEMILRQSAVQAIGEDKLLELNNLGNRRISEGVAPLPANDNQSAEPTTINFYLVDDRSQIPPLGAHDVVGIVSDNLQRGGALKTLVKSIQLGVA